MATQAKSQLELELLLIQEELAPKQEDQWAMMAEQGDISFREVLSQVSQANLVRLLPWFLFSAANPGAVPIYSVSEISLLLCNQGRMSQWTLLQNLRALRPWHP